MVCSRYGRPAVKRIWAKGNYNGEQEMGRGIEEEGRGGGERKKKIAGFNSGNGQSKMSGSNGSTKRILGNKNNEVHD